MNINKLFYIFISHIFLCKHRSFSVMICAVLERQWRIEMKPSGEIKLIEGLIIREDDQPFWIARKIMNLNAVQIASKCWWRSLIEFHSICFRLQWVDGDYNNWILVSNIDSNVEKNSYNDNITLVSGYENVR